MKNFFYKGIDLNGKEISGYLLAEDKSIAENILNNKGIIIEKIVNHRFFFNYIKPKNKNISLVPSIFTGKRNSSLQLNENHHLLVKAKPLSLQRAITNLIDNALKYGRRATLFLETSSESITLIVEDEGTNVSEDLLEYLKQPFLRGQNIGITKGTGLGLTIVSTIAEQHGGKLSFEKSKVGIKAKFTILRK